MGRIWHSADRIWHSVDRRAQVEPLAALVAVFAVGVALTTYAGVLNATLPTPDRNLAEPTVERVERAVTETGVVEPTDLSEGLSVGPNGYRMNLTLVTANRTWHAGPTPPHAGPTPPPTDGISSDRNTASLDATNGLDIADVAVSVRVGPGQIRPGRLRVEVWR